MVVTSVLVIKDIFSTLTRSNVKVRNDNVKTSITFCQRSPQIIYHIISRRFLILESSEKFRAPGENRTHARPSEFYFEALTTELLEAPWRAGSKLNHNYTSRWSFDNCNKDPKGDQSGRASGFISLPICFWLKILAFRPGCVRGRTSRSSVVNKELVSSQLTLHWLSVATYLSTLWFVILNWTRVALVSWPIRSTAKTKACLTLKRTSQLYRIDFYVWSPVAPYIVIILFVIHHAVITIA